MHIEKSRLNTSECTRSFAACTHPETAKPHTANFPDRALSPQLGWGERKQNMVLIYLEFSLFPSLGIVPEDLGMAQNRSLREFGRGPEGSHESDRFGFRGCFSRTVNVSNTGTKEVNGLRGCRLLNKQ